MTLEFIERYKRHSFLGFEIEQILLQKKSQYQELLVFRNPSFGNVMILDGCVMTSEKDEFFYHEQLVHVPMFSHENPENILIIGGGDGGTLREVLKHSMVKKVDMVEIDQMVITAAREYFPTLSCEFNNPKAQIIVQDGFQWVKEHKNEYDIIIIDSTDPVGPAEALITKEFYNLCKGSLKPKGIFTAQTESPLYMAETYRQIYKEMKNVFGGVAGYLGPVPTYPSGTWSWCLCAEKPLVDSSFAPKRPLNFETKFYTQENHKASFVLPPYARV